ncbi:MAG: transcriptional regulator [Desulfobacteraceae bacterium]|jgi:DNA-binding MarR family transcriptional regulator|nr:transcriptional regulator [Desulfobacteraceae bacterium]
MENLAHRFIEYITKLAGMPVTWGKAVSRPLPHYLNQQYALRKLTVGKRAFLGIMIKDIENFRPAAFEKHLRQIMANDAFDDFCLIAQELPGYTRRRLIERHIPFVIPGQQLYWPELGVAAQARKTARAPAKTETFTPATQAVLIYALNGGIKTPTTPKELAGKLGYAGMSMTRALDEIEGSGLGQITREGRERLLDFPTDGRTLWQEALPYLRTPVRKILRIKEDHLPPDQRMKAGEIALADLSMLVPPNEPVYALGRRDWKKLADRVEQIPVEDTGTCRIELWRYDPALFVKNNRVDHFSLYLSLQDEEDERLEMALVEMMEKTL